ncbi:MAG: phospho-sugar mutase [Geothrix sp.]|uniref:phospho-sugar mutase n=1 Tax=Geothrix sp. TaxID=1962974 RepID=UPI0017F2DEB4|nr:phospho-sugar mutase [Geothrix sp.]NWJ39365.1 phospho-sugar mutase [Geothrix sp.]WIL19410.1 MAG: phospho-sugar mutase [Geothrix sp.]
MSLSAAKQYLSFPHLEPGLRADLEPLVKAAEGGDAKAIAELEDRFFEPLAFGTGGLRGFMAAGLRRMNQPNVRRTTMALATVAQHHAPGKKVAVVGYDTRINSEVFAQESAAVLAAAGYQVFLGSRPLPTPFLCFAMKALGSTCGVIITASHNPKEYNGFKAYNDLGGQVVDPWDAEIEAHMATLPVVPVPPVVPEGRISPIPVEVENAYLALGLGLLQNPKPFTPARILYTPFHGTGVAFVPALFEKAGIPLTVSPSQGIQDGTFPTAPRPNPEELAAYASPLREAEAMAADVVLANDPDADRIGVVAKRDGAWELMSGNDLAALTLDYLCSGKGRQGAVVSTVVTSDFMAEVARHHGLPVVWTLTGFKNIAVCMDRLDQLGEAYAFGAEESYGMLLPPSLRDKDGVTAALVVAEMAGHYKAKGQTLFEAVEALMARVGTFHNRLVNLEDPRPGGAKRFAEAMGRIRTAGLATFGGEKVVSWEDFQTGLWHGEGRSETILDRPDHRAIALPIPFSNALKFRLESGAFAAFRPSGTEPKLKVYLQSRTDTALLDRMEAEARTLLGL